MLKNDEERNMQCWIQTLKMYFTLYRDLNKIIFFPQIVVLAVNYEANEL